MCLIDFTTHPNVLKEVYISNQAVSLAPKEWKMVKKRIIWDEELSQMRGNSKNPMNQSPHVLKIWNDY